MECQEHRRSDSDKDHDRIANKPLSEEDKKIYLEKSIKNNTLLMNAYSQKQTAAREYAQHNPGTSDYIAFADMHKELLTTALNNKGDTGTGAAKATIASAKVDHSEKKDFKIDKDQTGFTYKGTNYPPLKYVDKKIYRLLYQNYPNVKANRDRAYAEAKAAGKVKGGKKVAAL